MLISAQNNSTRQHQKAQGQGQGLAAGYAREYIKFDSKGGGERSSFCLPGTQPESILNHQPQNQTQATETREAHWWESFGGQCPQLQKFAIRILSQTGSASGCERNWSVFERIHTKKRNCLEHKRSNGLVFVQYNLRLRWNQLMNKTPDLDPIVLDDIDPTSEWVEETEDPVFEANFDFDAALAGGEFEADLVAPSDGDLGLVDASRKGKQPMEGTSHGPLLLLLVAVVFRLQMSLVAEASSDTDPDDVYAAADVDLVSSSGDEFGD